MDSVKNNGRQIDNEALFGFYRFNLFLHALQCRLCIYGPFEEVKGLSSGHPGIRFARYIAGLFLSDEAIAGIIGGFICDRPDFAGRRA